MNDHQSKNPVGCNAVAYARYSTNNQTKLSIERQVQIISGYCEREGIRLIGCYVDEAQTGTNMDRADFQRLLADAESGMFDAVVIYDMQRGSRDVADWFIFRKEMKRLNVQVISVNNTLGDIDNPNDFLQESITAVLGQHQVLQYRRDSIEGKKTRAQKGLFCGGIAPLGYDIVDHRYVINEREAAVVRTIFDMYAFGRSYNQIIDVIRKTGVTGKRGQVITGNTLHYILKNERYTGTYVWFEYEMRHMHKWVGRQNEQSIKIEDGIPRIIENHTWEAVQQRMQTNKKNTMNKSRVGHVYLLSGIIRCGECDSAMGGITVTSKGRTYKSYTCLDKRRLRKCTLKNIKGDQLEDFVLDFLRRNIFMPEVMEAMVDKIAEASANGTGEADALRREITQLDQKNGNLFVAIENGLASPDVIARANENAARKKQLEQRLSEIRPPRPHPHRRLPNLPPLFPTKKGAYPHQRWV